ncbi:MAG: Rpn family recombination-promoting nuclease/putative transposase, partial [Lachnospiraceae bacterium]|nr:Rpn family recombination-promoting nuclease/putative transposase [Lachnospiraceae bacterium]
MCSLLRLSDDDVISVEVMNPIELGKRVAIKDFFLDVKVSLNSQIVIHLEMQVIKQCNWLERPLSYLCKPFDNLPIGKTDLNAKPTIKIGLLNYTLFPEFPEFYASYEFRNTKNHHLY